MSADAMLSGRRKKFADLALERVTGGGRFSGYASLFDAVDMGRDAIAPGAFSKSLKERGAGGIRMLFQHDPNEPIGRWIEIAEDDRGLKVTGQLALEVERAREIHALLSAGAIDGLSIGFRAVKARSDGRTGVRRILEADLWEISVVTFPMLPAARVDAIAIYDEEGLPQEVDLADVRIELHRRPARVTVAAIRAPIRIVNGIEIDFTAGFGESGADVPDVLKRAMLIHIAAMYELRGVISRRDQPGTVPAGYERLIAPYRRRAL